MTSYYDDPAKDRQVKNYLRSLRRRARFVPTASRYLCVGGPWDANDIALSPNLYGKAASAPLRVGNHVGRYVEVPREQWWQSGIDTRLPSGVAGQVVWESM